MKVKRPISLPYDLVSLFLAQLEGSESVIGKYLLASIGDEDVTVL